MTLRMRLAAAALALAAAVPAGPPATAQDAAVVPVHAIDQYGSTPKYGPDFAHWDYVDPAAPKGGRLRLAAIGTFDSLNANIVRGTPAAGIGLIYETLITGNGDEATTVYADVAQSIEMADDRSWVIYNMRPEARFHDGHPMTAADVVFSFELLREKGRPLFRTRFAEVESVEALSEHRVRFTFAEGSTNRELPFTVGGLPILPKHYWEGREFDRTTLEPPLGSGPYRIAEVDPGRLIAYERVADWWAADLPQNRGRFNFDRVEYEYYRDVTVMYEAFKAGRFDFVAVNSSQEWSTGFEGLAPVVDGRMILEEIPSGDPAGFSGFWFNLRNPLFRDPRVREALTYFYDFETARRTIHYGLYERTRSWFPNTELSATGLPEGAELEVLERFRGRVPDSLFTEAPSLPTTDGSGNIRANLRAAARLFEEAGWEVRDGVLTNVETGRPMRFEILFRAANLEKVINGFVENLARGGIQAVPRLVDTAQWGRRMDTYDFEVALISIRAFYPPGPELRDLWNSRSADVEGNENFTGVKDPVLDELVELVIGAEAWDDLVARARALDRYLLSQHLAIPTYYNDAYRIAYWDKFGRPEIRPRYGLSFWDAWWYDPSNAAAARENR